MGVEFEGGDEVVVVELTEAFHLADVGAGGVVECCVLEVWLPSSVNSSSDFTMSLLLFYI